MTDITDLFLRYRDITRFLWNTELRHHPDGELEYSGLDSRLFEALVLSRLRTPLDAKGYATAPAIRVVPVTSSTNATVLEAHEAPDCIFWRESSIVRSTDMRYVRLFDFDTYEEQYRDFRYVEAVVRGETPGRFLLDASRLQVFDAS